MNQTDLDQLLLKWKAAEPDGFLLTEREAAQMQDAKRRVFDPVANMENADPAEVKKTIDALFPLADEALGKEWFCLLADSSEVEVIQADLSKKKTVEADAVRNCESLTELKTLLGLRAEQKAIRFDELSLLMHVLLTFLAANSAPRSTSETKWAYIKTSEIFPVLMGLRQRRAKPPASKLAEYTSEISSLNGSVLARLSNNVSLTESAKPLLVAFLEVIAASGFQGRKVSLAVDSYMQQRGFKSRDAALKQIRQDLDVLFSTHVEFSAKRKHVKFHVLSTLETGRKGDIDVWFDPTFIEYCEAEMRAMPHVSYLQRLDQRNNPYSYALGFKLETHKWLNGGKPNEDIISVAALLEVAGFPTEEEITNWHYDERIVKPFFRDMDALAPILSWELQHRGGKPLSDAERENMDYHQFKRLFVRVSWKAYPIEEQKKLQGKRRKKADTGSDTPEKPKRGRPKKGNG